MTLSNTFTTIFDKAISNGHAHEYENKWVVVEHGKDATMTHLEVNANGKFLGFDQDLVKGVKDTTTKMSSNFTSVCFGFQSQYQFATYLLNTKGLYRIPFFVILTPSPSNCVI